MDDLIWKQDAVDALEQVLNLLWGIDIPSATIPEYIEHHEQVQSVMAVVRKLKEEIESLPSALPGREPDGRRDGEGPY